MGDEPKPTPGPGGPFSSPVLSARDRASGALAARALLLAVAAVLGLFGLAILTTPRAELPPHIVLSRSVFNVRVAVEEHALNHDQLYPASADWLVTLRREQLLGEAGAMNALQPSPWGGGAFTQANVVPLPRWLPTAAQLAHGAQAPPLGAPLAPGHAPTSATFDAQTWGAILYDHDGVSGTYVIYGLGKVRDQIGVRMGGWNAGGTWQAF